jgi:LysR family transcriptional regulator for metE and metH
MTGRLELHHYDTILAVVDMGSVGAAASHLMVSQSAVSHRIAEAERRIGSELFTRRPARTLLPTPVGLAMYQAAQRALPELRRAERDVARSAGDALDVVRIGVSLYDCYHWLPGFHAVVQEHLGQILLELVVVGDSPFDRLSDSTVDVVLAPGAPIGSMRSVRLFDDELVLVVEPGHPAARQPWVDPEVVEGQTFLGYSSRPSLGFEFDRFLDPAGVSPRTYVAIQQTGAIAEMVAAGLGLSILSRWAVSPRLEAGSIVGVQCGVDGLPLEWNAWMRASTPNDGVEVRTAELLADWLERTVEV